MGAGVVAVSHGRRFHELIDAPSFGRPGRIRWRQRTTMTTDQSRFAGVTRLWVDEHVRLHVSTNQWRTVAAVPRN